MKDKEEGNPATRPRKPPRDKGDGLIRKRADGRWEGRLDVTPPGGKRKRVAVYGKTKPDVAEKMRQKRIELSRGAHRQHDTKTTVEKYLLDWLETTVRTNLRLSTYYNYHLHVHNYIIPRLGDIPLVKLEPEDIEALLAELAVEVKKGDNPHKALSGGTLRKTKAILSSALRKALRRGLIDRNVATLVEPPPVDTVEVVPFTLEEARLLLDAVRGTRMEGMYTVALSLGLRRGELVGLRWEDVDFEAGTLSVRQSIQRLGGELVIGGLKNKSARRTIVLPAVTLSALRRHSTWQRFDRRAAGERWRESGLVFTNTLGSAVEPRNVNRHFYAILEKAGVSRLRPHDMRHTAATLMKAQGVDIATISKILGHSSIRITQDIYVHGVIKDKIEAARSMDSILGTQAEDEAEGQQVSQEANEDDTPTGTGFS